MDVKTLRKAIGEAYGDARVEIEVMAKLDELCLGLESIEKIRQDIPIANIDELLESIHVVIANYGKEEMDVIAQSFNNHFTEFKNKTTDLEEFLASLNSLLGTNMYIDEESMESSKMKKGANVRLTINLNKNIDQFYDELARILNEEKSEILTTILTEAIFEDETIKELLESDERMRDLAESLK